MVLEVLYYVLISWHKLQKGSNLPQTCTHSVFTPFTATDIIMDHDAKSYDLTKCKKKIQFLDMSYYPALNMPKTGHTYLDLKLSTLESLILE